MERYPGDVQKIVASIERLEQKRPRVFQNPALTERLERSITILRSLLETERRLLAR
jgi:hypothetical protein